MCVYTYMCLHTYMHACAHACTHTNTKTFHQVTKGITPIVHQIIPILLILETAGVLVHLLRLSRAECPELSLAEPWLDIIHFHHPKLRVIRPLHLAAEGEFGQDVPPGCQRSSRHLDLNDWCLGPSANSPHLFCCLCRFWTTPEWQGHHVCPAPNLHLCPHLTQPHSQILITSVASTGQWMPLDPLQSQ